MKEMSTSPEKRTMHPYVEDFLRRRGIQKSYVKPQSDGSIILVFDELFRVHIRTVGYKSIVIRSLVSDVPVVDVEKDIFIDKVLKVSHQLFITNKVTISYDQVMNACYMQLEVYDLRASNELDAYIDNFVTSLHSFKELMKR